MSRTTQEWEQLLAAANVSEDLEVRYDDWDEKWQIGTEDETESLPGWWWIAELDSEHKARLFAATPDAVAEVIRLRTALEEALAVCEDGGTHRHVAFAKILTRILNGDLT